MTEQRSVHYIGFWARFVATLVDTIVLGFILAPVGWLLGFSRESLVLVNNDGVWVWDAPGTFAPALGMHTGLQALALAILVIVFWKWKSATPGKMVIGAVIVDANTLAPPSTGQLIGRYLGYFISALFMGLGFLWVAFDGRKQGWHDKLAGTLVIGK